MAAIERRARTLTGLILAVVAFVATYGLMLYEGQTTRPAFHFYPWLLAAVFYLAGDLLAFVWFKTMLMQMLALMRQQALQRPVRLEPEEEPPSDVEIIRPPGAKE